jgi:pyruvate dehydrogenase E2 component (dihydrolipoamide acetyltransferase)
MGYIIKMPQMGLEMEEGEVVAWEVDVDEPTEEGDIVVVVESEKAVNEVEAREDGAVREIFVPEGKVVEPGDPIGVFGGPEEDITDLIAEAEAMSDTSAAESASAGSDDEPSETGDPRGATASEEQIRATPGAEKLANDMGIDLSVIDGSGPQGTITEADVEQQASDEGIEESSSPSVRATPGAKQVAEERGVELTSIDGTGPQGVVTESDVENHASESAEASTDVRATPGAKQLAAERDVELASIDGTGPQGVVTESDVEDHAGAGTDDGSTAVRTVSESRRLSSIQQTISDRMSASHREAPHVTLNRSFDATTLREVQTAAANEGVDVSLTDLLVRGVGMELADRPAFNALFEDGTHKLIEEVNIGIAVDIEEGLVTPVVPSVAEKSVEEIAAVRRERTQRALNGEFEMSDMEGGTFTITNLGMFDIDSFDPIINPPEVAILGVGRIQDDGAMILSLSFDHRVVNGADAARFLDGTVGNLTDAKWLADQFDENIFGALIEHLSE